MNIKKAPASQNRLATFPDDMRGGISPHWVSSCTARRYYHQSLISSGYRAKPYQPNWRSWQSLKIQIFENKPVRRTTQNTTRKEGKTYQGVDQLLIFFCRGLGFRSNTYSNFKPLGTQGLGGGKARSKPWPPPAKPKHPSPAARSAAKISLGNCLNPPTKHAFFSVSFGFKPVKNEVTPEKKRIFLNLKILDFALTISKISPAKNKIRAWKSEKNKRKWAWEAICRLKNQNDAKKAFQAIFFYTQKKYHRPPISPFAALYQLIS